jgi:glucans biosynthesis protein C
MERNSRAAPGGPNRLRFVDNLRGLMILLVLSMHACDTYSPFGNWYYKEASPNTLFSAIVFGSYQSFLQAFFMGLLFMIAGFFADRSLARKGRRQFVRDRLWRLGVPTLLYALLIGPLTQHFLSRTWGTDTFPHEWLHHLTDGELLSETGPMWFAAALLLFSLLYALRSVPAISRSSVPEVPAYATIQLTLLLLAAATFVTRIWFREDRAIFNFHVGDFPQYILMFYLGAQVQRNAWLDGIPSKLANRIAAGNLIIAVGLWFGLLSYGGALQGDVARYGGGANWVSMTKCLWEALVCFGMTFALLISLRSWFDYDTMLSRLVSRNAFAVYLFHPPLLIAAALWLHPLVGPPLFKAALLMLLGSLISFAAAEYLFRRIPGLARIL